MLCIVLGSTILLTIHRDSLSQWHILPKQIGWRRVHWVVEGDVPAPLSLEDIQRETRKDCTLSKVYEHLQQGTDFRKMDTDLQPYRGIADELSIAHGVIIRGQRIVLPKSLHKKVIRTAHEGHQTTPPITSMVSGVGKEGGLVHKHMYSMSSHSTYRSTRAGKVHNVTQRSLGMSVHGFLRSYAIGRICVGSH